MSAQPLSLTVSLLHVGDVQLSPLAENEGQPIRRFNLVRPATAEEKAEAGVSVPGALLVYWTGLNGFPDGANVWPGYDPITVLRADLIIEEEVSARELLARDHVARSADAANFLAGREVFHVTRNDASRDETDDLPPRRVTRQRDTRITRDAT